MERQKKRRQSSTRHWRARFGAPSALLLLGACGSLLGCGSELKGEMMDGDATNPDGTLMRGYQELSITNPKNGDYYPSQLVVVQGYSEIDGEILVNGESTTATDGMFSHTLRIREEGKHQIKVEVPETGAERVIDITLDTTSPKFTVTKPAPGSFISTTFVEIEGHVDDANVDFITINDREYGVKADGSFVGEASVHKGAHHWRIEAVDAAGNVTPGSVSFLAGDFSTNGARTKEAVTLELGNDMINVISDGIRPEITAARIRAQLTANNPIINDWYGTVSLTSYSHSGVAVSIVPKDGYLNVALSIGGIKVPFTFDHALPGVINGNATATAVSVTGRIYLGIDTAGRPTASLRNISTALVGFAIDVRDWPPEVDELVTNKLRNQIQQSVTDILKSNAPPAVRESLQGLPLRSDFEVFGHAGIASGRVSELTVTTSGLFAAVDLGVRAASPDPTLAGMSGPFVLGHEPPTSTGTRDAHARVALDLVNRVSHAAWTTGEAKFTIESPVLPGDGETETEITVGSLALLFPSVKGMANDDLSIDLELSTALPPVVTDSGERIVVTAPDVRATILAKDGDQRTELFTLSVLAKAEVDFTFAGSTLQASIANYEIEIDAFGEVPNGFQSGEELQELFEKLLKPRIEPLLDLGAFEIPEITGYSLNAEEATLSDGYIEAGGTLIAR